MSVPCTSPETPRALAEGMRYVVPLHRFTAAIFRHMAPHVRGRILEVGAGLGTMTALLLTRGPVLALDAEPAFVDETRRCFADRSDYAAAVHDIAEPLPLDATFDTVVCLHVLEHVEDDDRALRHLVAALKPAGRLILAVPVHPWLYTPFDAAIGHHRRYRAREFPRRVAALGLRVLAVRTYNLLGLPAYIWNFGLLRKRQLPTGQLHTFDRLIPLMEFCDAVAHALGLRWGLSLLVVAERPLG